MSGLLANQNNWYKGKNGKLLHAIVANRSGAQIARNTLKELVQYTHDESPCLASLRLGSSDLGEGSLELQDPYLAKMTANSPGTKAAGTRRSNTPEEDFDTQFDAVAKYCNVTSRLRLIPTYHVQEGAGARAAHTG